MKINSILLIVSLSLTIVTVQSKCSKSCGLALASYYVWEDSNLTFIATVLKSSLVDPADLSFRSILDYNSQIPNKDNVLKDTRINVPFPCGCVDGEFLGHMFQYDVNTGDSYTTIARYYANLTTVESLQSSNSYPTTNIPDTGTVNVTVNCSCGDASNKDYGLFITYPLRPEDSLASIASTVNLSQSVIQGYNPGVSFSRGSGLVFIPGRGNFFSIMTLF